MRSQGPFVKVPFPTCENPWYRAGPVGEDDARAVRVELRNEHGQRAPTVAMEIRREHPAHEAFGFRTS
jgi:hypothetical protein